VRSVSEVVARRRARRWQHWTEVPPEDDFARRAGIVTAIFVTLMLLVLVLIVVGVVLAVS
jgi:hypothetical protein